MVVDIFGYVEELTLKRFAMGDGVVRDGSGDEIAGNYEWRVLIFAREMFTESVIRALNRTGPYLSSASVMG